jgi:hypothetical protein
MDNEGLQSYQNLTVKRLNNLTEFPLRQEK